MHEYGKSNWESLWEKLEQIGNVGLDFVINPVLYPKIIDYLAEHPKSLITDFGCGTNMMGIQLLYGNQASVAALQNLSALNIARFNLLLYVGIEGSTELVRKSNAYLSDIGSPKNIATIQHHLGQTQDQLFDSNTLDLCTSRNFLIHLSNDDLNHHFDAVRKALSPNGRYILATLNPEYEKLKANQPIKNGERYEYVHGKNGEHGTFYHYYRDKDTFETITEKYFNITEKTDCMPISNDYKETHSRYYDPNIPMAQVYVLEPKK
jgi:SAM-dependent methyltransferase